MGAGVDGPLTGLDHVQLAAPPGCEDATRRFYGRLLGLVEEDKPEALRGRGGVWFHCGTQGLHVGVDPCFVPATKAHPGLTCRDESALAALAERLAAAGHAVEWDRAIPDTRRFYVRDPFGNRLELLARRRGGV